MINKATLKSEIKSAFVDEMNATGDRTESIDRLADKIADAVVKQIKDSKITYTTGLTAPNGPVVGNFTYTIT